MTVGGQQVSATVPSGSGFHVVEIDPLSGVAVRSDGFASAGQEDMSTRLNAIQHAGHRVAIQSIGATAVDPSSDLGLALLALGATPQALAGPGYALLGGTALTPADVVEASPAVVVDPTTVPPTTQGQRIVARLSPRHAGGGLVPRARAFPGAAADLNLALYDIVHRDPTQGTRRR